MGLLSKIFTSSNNKNKYKQKHRVDERKQLTQYADASTVGSFPLKQTHSSTATGKKKKSAQRTQHEHQQQQQQWKESSLSESVLLVEEEEDPMSSQLLLVSSNDNNNNDNNDNDNNRNNISIHDDPFTTLVDDDEFFFPRNAFQSSEFGDKRFHGSSNNNNNNNTDDNHDDDMAAWTIDNMESVWNTTSQSATTTQASYEQQPQELNSPMTNNRSSSSSSNSSSGGGGNSSQLLESSSIDSSQGLIHNNNIKAQDLSYSHSNSWNQQQPTSDTKTNIVLPEDQAQAQQLMPTHLSPYGKVRNGYDMNGSDGGCDYLDSSDSELDGEGLLSSDMEDNQSGNERRVNIVQSPIHQSSLLRLNEEPVHLLSPGDHLKMASSNDESESDGELIGLSVSSPSEKQYSKDASSMPGNSSSSLLKFLSPKSKRTSTGSSSASLPALAIVEQNSSSSSSSKKNRRRKGRGNDKEILLGNLTDNDSSDEESDPNNHWLFKGVEDTLGSPGFNPDVETLSGMSHKSGGGRSIGGRSHRSHRSHRSGGGSRTLRHYRRRDEQSVGSHDSFSRGSRDSYYSRQSGVSEHSKSVANDLRRLEKELTRNGGGSSYQGQNHHHIYNSSTRGGSSVGGTSRASRLSVARSVGQVSVKTVLAPPGKLGVILGDSSAGKGTLVTKVRPNSPLVEKVCIGDRIIEIDGEDVSLLTVSELTSIMARKSGYERVLTICSGPKYSGALDQYLCTNSDLASLGGTSYHSALYR